MRRIRQNGSFGLLSLLSLAGLAGCSEAPDVPEPVVRFVDCAPEDAGDPAEGAVAIECGFLTVPENRAAGGRTIDVYFIRARATGADPLADPVIYLAGGPGGAGTGNPQRLFSRSAYQLERHDLILVDQRGTGRSAPLDCVQFDLVAEPERFQELFDVNLFDPDRFRACLARLESQADLTQYTTSIIADDIDDLRHVLGYEAMSLEGGSYGTRLGLEIVRRHGDRVRAAVLRGVAPSFAFLVERVAWDMETALDDLVAACATDPVCHGAYPEFGANLKQVLARVRETPVRVDLPNPGTGEVETVTLRYPELVTALRYVLYSVNLSASLPLQVQAAVGGDYAPMAGILSGVLPGLYNLLADGMWASVICTEEAPFVDVDQAGGLSEGTVLGTLRLDATLSICGFWPRGDIPDGFHDPVSSTVPVLLVAGEFDPAAPLDLAEDAARHLPNGALVKMANRSHWGLSGGPCIEGIVEQFLETASVEGLDLACTAALERPPFALPDA